MDYKSTKKTRASNSSRKLRLAKAAKLNGDNVTIWTGVNADLGNRTLFVGGFIDGGAQVQVEGYYRSESDAIAELESILADKEKIRLSVVAQVINAKIAHRSALERAAELARDRGEHQLAERILKIELEIEY